MENVRLTIVQTQLFWENALANRNMFDEKLSGLEGKTDIVILPEMFTTGFSMNAEPLAESMDGETFRWLQAKARALNAVVTGSIMVREGERFFNRLLWVRPDGTFAQYDKRHLFTLANEHRTYTSGREKIIIEWKGWRICPMICYDLRFPVWARNAEGYDLLIYVANWPETRSYHWRTLLTARAIENQSFVAGVNRVGADEAGLVYAGDSSLIDYAGRVLYRTSGVEDVFSCTLEKRDLTTFREKLNFLHDQDKFKIYTDRH